MCPYRARMDALCKVLGIIRVGRSALCRNLSYLRTPSMPGIKALCASSRA